MKATRRSTARCGVRNRDFRTECLVRSSVLGLEHQTTGLERKFRCLVAVRHRSVDRCGQIPTVREELHDEESHRQVLRLRSHRSVRPDDSLRSLMELRGRVRPHAVLIGITDVGTIGESACETRRPPDHVIGQASHVQVRARGRPLALAGPNGPDGRLRLGQNGLQKIGFGLAHAANVPGSRAVEIGSWTRRQPADPTTRPSRTVSHQAHGLGPGAGRGSTLCTSRRQPPVPPRTRTSDVAQVLASLAQPPVDDRDLIPGCRAAA